mmetsp:Transcript_15705/g.47505  ORF Transcript_15705/g.47505 Transcript_15705/m.47505 type:complete len:449 (+) Transcript_15705:234-1580(+)
MERYAAWEKAGEGSWSRLKEVEGRLVDDGKEDGGPEAVTGRRKRREDEEEDAGGRVFARGLIRQVVLIVDASRAALTADIMRPTRLGAAIAACSEFVVAFFAANPVSSLAIAKAQNGGAARLSRLSGSQRTHLEALKSLSSRQHFPPSGDFSLSAALEEARSTLAKTPDYGKREILLVVSSLATRDGEDLFAKTTKRLRQLNISFNVVALSGGETHVFKELARSLNGSFTVALDRGHFGKLLAAHVPPPKVTREEDEEQRRKPKKPPTLVEMGFPTLKVDAEHPKLCAIAVETTSSDKNTLQLEWKTKTYTCPRCAARVASLPCSCPVCDLPLVSAPHLAASYHHLFPVPRFTEVNLLEQAASFGPSARCYGCFDPLVPEGFSGDDAKAAGLFVYVCPKTNTPFCAACDEYIHTSLHNCPACDDDRGGRDGGGSGKKKRKKESEEEHP